MSEVERRAPDCYAWLRATGITCIKITNAAVVKAAEIKSLLGIVNDRYNAAGVGENDILIVASACVGNQQLISNESKQPSLPTNKAKYKIPLVCSLAEVEIDCIDFLTLIKQSARVFDSAGPE